MIDNPKEITAQTGAAPLVKPTVIAKALDVTPRYVRILTAEGRIPCHRLSSRCIRYNLNAVLQAIQTPPSN
jgi:hypothetical protein